MKRITKLTTFALAVVVAVFGLPAAEKADDHNSFNFDVACDCRTANWGAGTRGEVFIVNGKIFPARTLPSGKNAGNDPTLPVNGVGPIGDWICRGQVAGTFPSDAPPSYALTPFAFYTQYYILKNGTFFTEGYPAAQGGGQSAVIGGFGSFSGMSGDLVAEDIGTNISGCPNIRFKVNFQNRSQH